jgi:hypothetical protein
MCILGGWSDRINSDLKKAKRYSKMTREEYDVFSELLDKFDEAMQCNLLELNNTPPWREAPGTDPEDIKLYNKAKGLLNDFERI